MTIVHITYHDETNIGSCPIGQTGGFENADGNGEIHCFRIFDGVSVMLMQLEMGSYTEIRTQVGVLEVNFCINGRFETSFSMRSHVLLKPGDMAISCYDGLHGTKSESHFPLGYYEGLCLEIDPAAAGHWIRLNAPAFPIDFTALKQNLLGSKWYMVGPAGPRCEHVFRELYESASYAERGFLQLKVLELMLLLGRIPQERAADPYCSAEQTALAHHLRDHLLTDREGYVSLSQLAAEHEISVSHLQKIFKRVYGVPVYHYIKEYLFSPFTVAIGLFLGGLLLMFAEYKTKGREAELVDDVDKISIRQAVWVGIYQFLSLWPGFSRSGSTIAGGLLVGLTRSAAANYTFVIAVPLMFAACIYDLLKNLQYLSAGDLQVLVIGFVVSFIVAYISVLWFLKFLQNSKLTSFAVYRILLAGVTYWYFYM